jgi:hypothetical protein
LESTYETWAKIVPAGLPFSAGFGAAGTMSKVAKVAFTDYEKSIARALDLVGAAQALPQNGLIIICDNEREGGRGRV